MKKRTIRESVAALFGVQAFDYLIPIILLPYLIRTLGAENFGHVAFVQALSSYFITFIEYGFNWSGVRRVSVFGTDKVEISRIFWTIQILKLIFFSISVLVIFMLLTLTNLFDSFEKVIFLSVVPLIGSVVFPLWFLQGIERTREAAIMMISSRVMSLVCTVIFVQGPDDLELAVFIQTIPMFVAGILSAIYLFRNNLISLEKISFGMFVYTLKDGQSAFVTTAFSSLYRSVNSIVLGLLVGPASVGMYSIVEKLVQAIQGLVRPISQATYPRIAQSAKDNEKYAISLLRKNFIAVSVMGITSGALLSIFSSNILQAVGGAQLDKAGSLLTIMAFTPLIGGINLVLGMQYFNAFGYGGLLSRYVAFTGLLNVAVLLPTVVYFQEVGAAFCYLFSELILFILLSRFHLTKGTGVVYKNEQ